MRFSNFIIFFQSATYCVATLTAFKTAHIAETSKAYLCEGNLFTEANYRRQKVDADYKIRNRLLSPFLQSQIDDILRSEKKTRPVMYGDGNIDTYYLYKLAEFSTSIKNRYFITRIDYHLLIDDRYQVCALLLQKVTSNQNGSQMNLEDMGLQNYSFCSLQI